MGSCREVELFRGCVESLDENLWARFVRCFDDRIRGLVRRALNRTETSCPSADVEDLVQDVYCRLVERCRRRGRRFRGASRGEVLTYLQRVCDSVVVDLLRSRRAIKRGGRITLLSIDGAREGSLEEVLADPTASPETDLMVRERRRGLMSSCRTLHEGPHRERDLGIFELAVLEGWTSREIAEGCDFGLKAGSIDSLLHRQRRRLEARGVVVPRR